jgi:hypothetical protein
MSQREDDYRDNPSVHAAGDLNVYVVLVFFYIANQFLASFSPNVCPTVRSAPEITGCTDLRSSLHMYAATWAVMWSCQLHLYLREMSADKRRATSGHIEVECITRGSCMKISVQHAVCPADLSLWPQTDITTTIGDIIIDLLLPLSASTPSPVKSQNFYARPLSWYDVKGT